MKIIKIKSTHSDSNKPVQNYQVGDKCPPLHTRFQKGVSGNPAGRPKRKPTIHESVLKKLQTTVAVTMKGKLVKMNYMDLFITKAFEAGLTEGPQSKLLLLKMIEQALADKKAAEAKAEEAKKLKESNSISNFSWSEEAEKLYQELKDFEDAPLNNDDDDEEPGVQN